jgi:hypothetical protein
MDSMQYLLLSRSSMTENTEEVVVGSALLLSVTALGTGDGVEGTGLEMKQDRGWRFWH